MLLWLARDLFRVRWLGDLGGGGGGGRDSSMPSVAAMAAAAAAAARSGSLVPRPCALLGAWAVMLAAFVLAVAPLGRALDLKQIEVRARFRLEGVVGTEARAAFLFVAARWRKFRRSPSPAARDRPDGSVRRSILACARTTDRASLRTTADRRRPRDLIPSLSWQVRKLFHGLAIALFVPGALLEPALLRLSYGVALALLLVLEVGRRDDVPHKELAS